MTSMPTHLTPDQDADRPVYCGMTWSDAQDGRSHMSAMSDTTPATYVVEEIEDGRFEARYGFPDAPGRPNAVIGVFSDRIVALTAAERHDFMFWASGYQRAGKTPIFMGSPDHVSDFISNLSEHDRDDILDMIAGGYQLPDGSDFSTSASYFPATKTGLKQDAAGTYSMTIRVRPEDLPMWLIQSKPGTDVVLGCAAGELQDADDWEERSANAIKRTFGLALDNTFHAWMARKYDRWGLIASAARQTSEEVEAAVTETLRRLIGCPSRRELKTNRDAVLRLEKIDREFYLDMSRGFAPG